MTTTKPKSYRVVREFHRHKVQVIRRINNRFRDLPRYKRLLMILDSEKGPFSRLEIVAGMLPQYTDPRTGLMTLQGKTAFGVMVRKLNRNGYADKYPFAKVYSLPFVDEDDKTVDSGIAIVRYYLIMIYGKSIAEVIARMEKVIDGLTKSIRRLEDVKAVGARKVVRELEKYKQQIEYEATMIRQKRRRGGVGTA